MAQAKVSVICETPKYWFLCFFHRKGWCLEEDIRTSFLPAWTVKVGSYNDLKELERESSKLKKMGYKVYSQYDSGDRLNYFLFIGRTACYNHMPFSDDSYWY